MRGGGGPVVSRGGRGRRRERGHGVVDGCVRGAWMLVESSSAAAHAGDAGVVRRANVSLLRARRCVGDRVSVCVWCFWLVTVALCGYMYAGQVKEQESSVARRRARQRARYPGSSRAQLASVSSRMQTKHGRPSETLASTSRCVRIRIRIAWTTMRSTCQRHESRGLGSVRRRRTATPQMLTHERLRGHQ